MRRILRPLLEYSLDIHLVMGDRNRLHVGERAALANTIFNVASGEIYVGDRVIFSPNVMVLTGRHDFHLGSRVSVHQQWDDGSWGGGSLEVPVAGHDVVIGDGSWIGAGAILLGPITLGRHCIVAAGSVVTHNVEDHQVVAGVPAKVIGDTRNRTSPQIQRLEK